MSVSSSKVSEIEIGAYTVMLTVVVKPAADTSSVADNSPEASLISATETSHEDELSEKDCGLTVGEMTEQLDGLTLSVAVLDWSELRTAATIAL